MNIVPTNHVKICVIGSSNVGKTCIARRYVSDEFKSGTHNTIALAFFMKNARVGDKTFKLHIWDTAGQDRYHALIPMYYRGAHAAIIVYDITSKETYEDLAGWVTELHAHLSPNVIISIVGNKCDLMYERQVEYRDAQIYAKCISASYFETSAKTGECVEELFQDICKRYAPKARLLSSPTSEPDTHDASIKLPSRKENKKQKKTCCKS